MSKNLYGPYLSRSFSSTTDSVETGQFFPIHIPGKAMASRSLTSAAPRLGEKLVYLPTSTITLLHPRNPYQPPTTALFQTPLKFTKLDLTSYLFNAYNLRVSNVRSYIQHQRLLKVSPHPRVEGAFVRKVTKERRVKRMFADFERPFVWPKAPESFAPWDQELYQSLEKGREQESERDTTVRESGEQLWMGKEESQEWKRQRDQRLKSATEEGADGLKDGAENWEDVGGMVEVLERVRAAVGRLEGENTRSSGNLESVETSDPVRQ
jgi:hypothetical protein